MAKNNKEKRGEKEDEGIAAAGFWVSKNWPQNHPHDFANNIIVLRCHLENNKIKVD